MAECAKSDAVKIVALCDVDDKRALRAMKEWPGLPYYKDYREMLDKESAIDAVTISTPDHMHGIQSMAAMEKGKHVYVQKPLTHDIAEARELTQAAHQYKVVTQMGNQGASGEGVRLMQEWYNAGLIGDVTDVWCWTNRPRLASRYSLAKKKRRLKFRKNLIGIYGSERLQEKTI